MTNSDTPDHADTYGGARDVLRSLGEGDRLIYNGHSSSRPLTVSEMQTTDAGQYRAELDGHLGGTHILQERLRDVLALKPSGGEERVEKIHVLYRAASDAADTDHSTDCEQSQLVTDGGVDVVAPTSRQTRTAENAVDLLDTRVGDAIAVTLPGLNVSGKVETVTDRRDHWRLPAFGVEFRANDHLWHVHTYKHPETGVWQTPQVEKTGYCSAENDYIWRLLGDVDGLTVPGAHPRPPVVAVTGR